MLRGAQCAYADTRALHARLQTRARIEMLGTLAVLAVLTRSLFTPRSGLVTLRTGAEDGAGGSDGEDGLRARRERQAAPVRLSELAGRLPGQFRYDMVWLIGWLVGLGWWIDLDWLVDFGWLVDLG